MSPQLTTGLILTVVAAIVGLGVWSIQRIIGRMDSLGDKVDKFGARFDQKFDDLGNRVTFIEAKQDSTGNNVRKTARKVGVLPRDIEQTIDPRQPVHT